VAARHRCNTASQSCSGSRSPVLACSMILCATTSLAISPQSVSRSAISAISYARPMTRIVSGSNIWPLRWDRIGMLPNSQPPTPWSRAAVGDADIMHSQPLFVGRISDTGTSKCRVPVSKWSKARSFSQRIDSACRSGHSLDWIKSRMARVHPQAATATIIPRGTYFGRPIGIQSTDEAEHFIRCPGCSGRIDCRDLGQVFEQGLLPHRRGSAAMTSRALRHEAEEDLGW
jgi:hypothetical protein